MKRKGFCRLWALLLTVILCIAAFSVTAFACENPEDGEPVAPVEETEAEVPTLPDDFQSIIGNIDLKGLDFAAICDAILFLHGHLVQYLVQSFERFACLLTRYLGTLVPHSDLQDCQSTEDCP